jgi:uncharacterized protein YaeQ
MAQKSTIFKADLQVNDLDRHYYQAHALTLARHSSETDERMMVRLLAFALNAGPALSFGNGLSSDDEPDLWQKDLTGLIALWIDVGMPEAKLLKKAAGRAERVAVYTYGRNTARWWADSTDELERFGNLAVFQLPEVTTQALAALAERSMRLVCTIQEGMVTLSNEHATVEVEVLSLKNYQQRERGAYRK